MNAQFPIYIVSKGRADSRLTSKCLESFGQPYYIVIEEQEYDQYAAVIDTKKILILDRKYQDEYDTFDDLGYQKSKGPGAARNFAWDHSMSLGAEWHWVMDDNIYYFFRLNQNRKIPVGDATVIRAMEDFVLRYSNIAMAGPNYYMFAPQKMANIYPFTLNTRIYSCNLIRNDLQYRWRGRYNEDTDLSLRMLKDGWCTLQFNAFLQLKAPTQTIRGGNTKEFYSQEGTSPKSRMLKAMHPDVTELVYKFSREHHYVNYKYFQRRNKLQRKPGVEIPCGVNEYGMKLISLKNGEELNLGEV